jgi:rhodanese-related sulfurtransferase
MFRRFFDDGLGQSSYRSSLASSLLERHGASNLVNVIGGMSAWRALEATAT